MESIESIQIKDANPAVQKFLAQHINEYFYCEREKCIMRKTECLLHQKESEEKSVDDYNRRFLAGRSMLACERSNCWDCEQGKRIKEELETIAGASPSEIRSAVTTSISRGKEVMDMSEVKECIIEGCHETDIKARGMCKKHYDSWYNKERARSGKKLSERGIDGRKIKPDVTITPILDDNSIILDFENHPDILNQVRETARDELRPVDMQILYLVRKGLVDGKA